MMKNYRLADSCKNCRFVLEEPEEDLYNSFYCLRDNTYPQWLRSNLTDSQAKEYFRELQKWAREHRVLDTHVCDDYEEYK